MEVIKTGTDTTHQSMVSTTWNIPSYNLHSAGPPETPNDQNIPLPHSVTVRTATAATHERCPLGKTGREEFDIISHQPSVEFTTRHQHQNTARSVRSKHVVGYIPPEN